MLYVPLSFFFFLPEVLEAEAETVKMIYSQIY